MARGGRAAGRTPSGVPGREGAAASNIGRRADESHWNDRGSVGRGRSPKVGGLGRTCHSGGSGGRQRGWPGDRGPRRAVRYCPWRLLPTECGMVGDGRDKAERRDKRDRKVDTRKVDERKKWSGLRGWCGRAPHQRRRHSAPPHPRTQCTHPPTQQMTAAHEQHSISLHGLLLGGCRISTESIGEPHPRLLLPRDHHRHHLPRFPGRVCICGVVGHPPGRGTEDRLQHL